ncbi:MAG: hypothetical protein ACEQSA_05305 [Weeksellaceae bacterium]
MKKLILFLFGFLFLFLVKPTYAQDAVPALRFVCLDLQWCNDLAPEACGFIPGQHRGHRGLLRSSNQAKAVPNSNETYITECLDVDTNADSIPEVVCTTGNSTMDKKLFCGDENATSPECDHLSILQNSVQYSLDHDGSYGIYYKENNQFVKQPLDPRDPIATNSLGNIIPSEIAWQSYTPANLERKFLAWNFIQPTQQTGGGVGGQQQASLEFAFRSSSCSGQAWDPYGRVFDAVTLEPIPQTSVELSQLNPDTGTFDVAYANQQNPTIINPNATRADGRFSFLVVDGDYKLVSSRNEYVPMQRREASTIKPNAKNIYINPTYPEFYYSDSNPIQQRGRIEQRDIPMKPNIASGYRYPLSLMSQNSILDKDNNVIYTGAVSHPFAELVIEVCKKENGIEVCNGKTIYKQGNGGPDKDGKFQVTLRQQNLRAGEYFKKTFTPVDLNAIRIVDGSIMTQFLSWIGNVIKIPEVQAQDRSISTITQPIPTYLEGYAYDAEGNLMPNATVGIYVSFSEQALYTKKANQNGYFKITSEFLPTTEYELRYTGEETQTSVAQLSTSEFLTQNEEFMTVEEVDPYLFATSSSDPRRDVTPTYQPPQKISISPDSQVSQTPTNTTPTAAPVAGAPQQILLVGVVLLLLMGTAGLLLVMYLYKKRTQNTPLA